MGFFSTLFGLPADPKSEWRTVKSRVIVEISARCESVRADSLARMSEGFRHEDIAFSYTLAIVGMLSSIETFTEFINRDDPMALEFQQFFMHTDVASLVHTIGCMQCLLVRRSIALYQLQLRELETPPSIRKQAEKMSARFHPYLPLIFANFVQSVYGVSSDPGPVGWDPITNAVDGAANHSYIAVCVARGFPVADSRRLFMWSGLSGMVWARFYELWDLGDQMKAYSEVQRSQANEILSAL